MKENKFKRFWRRNGHKILNTLITVGSFALGYATCAYIESLGSDPKKGYGYSDDDYEDEYELYSGKQARYVDEDIFTRIAPKMEDLVLTEGLDEGYIEGTYNIDYPRNGDPDQGYYTVQKRVEVNVKDVTE